VKILIVGASGQVGWELCRALPAVGEVIALSRAELDLCRADDIRRTLRAVRPHIVVNAAAHTAVDKAESEPDLAREVNAVAPGVMADELRDTGGVLVHYSTDYVFDGRKAAPYDEDDEPSPLNVYGASKLEGERAVQAAGGRYLILRTSWVYGARGSNFLLSMLNLFRTREELRIVNDQIGAPTWSRWLAQSTAQILEQWLAVDSTAPRELSGIYHITAAGNTSWFGFASAIRELRSNARQPVLLPIPSVAYPAPARRPANSVLSNGKLERTFGVAPPSWQQLLRQCMCELEPGGTGHHE
jgi:dTDP-4-dehydrorhamnose reductase